MRGLLVPLTRGGEGKNEDEAIPKATVYEGCAASAVHVEDGQP